MFGSFIWIEENSGELGWAELSSLLGCSWPVPGQHHIWEVFRSMFNPEKMVLSYLFPLLLVFILFLYLGLVCHSRSLLVLAWFEIPAAPGFSAP